MPRRENRALLKPQIVLILAQSGEGKSTLAANLVARWPAAYVFCHCPEPDPAFYAFQTFSPRRPPPQRDCCWIVDEVDMLCPGGVWPSRETPWLRDAIHRGRKRNLTSIWCATRPQNVPKDIPSQCRRLFVGRMASMHDIEWMAHYWGHPTLVEQVPKLGPYEFLDVPTGR